MIDKGYLGNPRLKRTDTIIPFTEEQRDEWIRCSQDAEYFIENYVKIINVDRGLINFGMFGFQRKMVNTFANNRFVICKLPRQVGKTTTVTAYFLWKILFNADQNIAILANKGRLAMEILDKIKLAYEFLPLWMQQGVVVWNRGNIELENRSKVLAAATSSSAVRGGSFTALLLDEFAHVPRNLADNFFASVYPTISSGNTTQLIIVSTPLGMNHFYRIWTEAEEGRSDYVPISIHWSEVPGRDEKWKEQTIRNTSEEQFRQEHLCEFLGSTNTLISPEKLRAFAWKPPRKDNWSVDVYEDPIPTSSYVICADTSHGVGLDYSAFTVIDVTQFPYRLVAKFHSNTASPIYFPEVIARTGRLYNNAYVLAETNDIGQAMVDALFRDLEYENVFTTTMKGRAGQKLGAGFGGARSILGVKMTKQVKFMGCSNIKDIIETDKLLIQDFDIIQEFFTFISRKNSYEAEEGCHDDLVMTLVLFGWLVRQPMFRDLTNNDIRAKLAEERYANLMDDLLPAGFVDTGDEIENLERPLRDEDAWL